MIDNGLRESEPGVVHNPELFDNALNVQKVNTHQPPQ
jgi:hypothetical protein